MSSENEGFTTRSMCVCESEREKFIVSSYCSNPCRWYSLEENKIEGVVLTMDFHQYRGFQFDFH